MYTLTKRIEISGSHTLKLPYKSKCANTHGHNWIIEVEVKGYLLSKSGMLLDFSIIDDVIKNKYDHQHLNKVIKQPTAENLAKQIADDLNMEIVEQYSDSTGLSGNTDACVTKVTVQESEGNKVWYQPENSIQ